MKKEIPNLIKIEYPYDPSTTSGCLLLRFQNIINQGYCFKRHDFNLFCALSIREFGIDKLSPSLKNYVLNKDSIIPEVQFQITAFALEVGDEVEKTELELHLKERLKYARNRQQIVRKEIQRTGINPRKLNLNNSEYYRILLNNIAGFQDLTLIDWFVPIVLTYERLVHFYVKHVEETKFADGSFKRRSFIDYKHDELLTLIKHVLWVDEENIKDHFLLVSVDRSRNEDKNIKDYHRGFRKFSPIEMNGDKFKLSIDKNGVITSFYQIK
jgi:hypothetical protein